MDHTCDYTQMLNMIPMPAFTVQNGKVAHCNQLAQQLLLSSGMDIMTIFANGAEEYAQFTDGCLYADLTVQGTTWGASITKLSDGELFCLEQTGLTPELKAMSLLCSRLRIPLSSLSITAAKNPEGDLQHSLDRINRILNNVSNAHRFALDDGSQQQERSICAVLDEQLQECAELLQQAGIHLEYTLPGKDIFTALDSQMLRQAVYNLLSNAAQHTATGGTITVTLAHSCRQLRLTVADSGSGIPQEAQSDLFSRYTRQPGIEDGLNGVGLGMSIVRATASAHGGTVLVTSPPNGGTKVTMSLAIRSGKTTLHTATAPIVTPRDDGRVMLSEVLPITVYKH